MSLLEKASLIVTPNATKEGKLYSVVPNTTLGDMDVVRATTATRVNSAGLIESVAVNIPRIDYTNGSCPSLLVEPQRTNLLTYSEQYSDASWIKIGSTITADTTISPNGTQNADTLVITSGGYLLKNIFTFSAVTGQTITSTIFVKNQTTNFLQFGGATPAGTDVYSIETYANGWYRHKITRTFTVTSVATVQYIILQVGTHFIWGAQLEAGSYATSYIPTVATAVTRNADVISKSGISSLIGQTEGTIFLDLKIAKNNSISLSDNSDANNIIFNFSNFYSEMSVKLYANSILILDVYEALPSSGFKLCLKYKSGELKTFKNGVLINTNTSAFSFSNNLSFLGALLYWGGSNFEGGINSLQLYKTALTDTECINLTTL